MPSLADLLAGSKKKRIVDFLMDSQSRSDIGQGLTDSVNRGAVAGLLGGPVDAVSGVVNAGLMGLGYAGNKMGLLGADRMPQPIQKPVGGSEWIGDLLQRGGMVSENRNAPAEMLAGLLAPAAVKGASRAAFAAEQNAMAPTPYNNAARNQLGATVWHGSPHKFDKFDSSKIGTGEGNQAYGHGLYFAEHPEVSGGYAKFLSGDAYKQSPAYQAAMRRQDRIGEVLSGKYGISDKDTLMNMISSGEKTGVPDRFIESVKASDVALKKAYDSTPKGHLYKVDLPDEHIAKMLDWDKPLSQQPEAMKAFEKAFKDYAELYGNTPQTQNAYKDAMVALRGGNMTGEGGYKSLAAIMGGKSNSDTVSNVLRREYGVPGIRYLDQGSRMSGNGTSNFVVFPGNEGLLSILERNGQPLK